MILIFVVHSDSRSASELIIHRGWTNNFDSYSVIVMERSIGVGYCFETFDIQSSDICMDRRVRASEMALDIWYRQRDQFLGGSLKLLTL